MRGANKRKASHKPSFKRIVCLMLAVLLVVLQLSTGAAWGAGDDVTALLQPSLASYVMQNGGELAEGAAMDIHSPIKVYARFSVPVAGDYPTPDTYVKMGDIAELMLMNIGGFDFNTASADMVTGDGSGKKIGAVTFEKEGGAIIAKVLFDGDAEIFDGTYHSVQAGFDLELEYTDSGKPGQGGVHTVTVLNKEYTIVLTEPPPLPEEGYTVTKAASVSAAKDAVTWTVNLSATGGAALAGKMFQDALPDGAAYRPGSFTVNGVTAEPEITGQGLAYTFPEDTPNTAAVTLITDINEDAWTTVAENGSLILKNVAGLWGDTEEPLGSGEAAATVKPTSWVDKTGVLADAFDEHGYYNPYTHSIIWTVTANTIKANLGAVTFTESYDIALGEDFRITARMGGGADVPVPNSPVSKDGDMNSFSFTLDDVNDRVVITITMKLPDTLPANPLVRLRYSNMVKMVWSHGSAASSASVGVGVDGIAKSVAGADLTKGIVKWSGAVDARALAEGESAVAYDLVIYGGEAPPWGTGFVLDQPAEGFSWSAALYNKLRENCAVNQRIRRDSLIGLPAGAAYMLYTVKNGAGEAVADLLVITGITRDNKAFALTFETQANAEIVLGEEAIRNIFYLNVGNFWDAGAANTSQPTNLFAKNGLSATDARKLESGAYPTGWLPADQTDTFDYHSKTAVFALVVNSSKLDFEEYGLGANGLQAGEITVTDTLPAGWAFREIGETGLCYAIYNTMPSAGAAAIDPQDVAIEGGTIRFTFSAGDISETTYHIFIKAGPTEAQALEYFSQNGTFTPRNTAALAFENWAAGSRTDSQDVTVKSEVIQKSFTGSGTGVLYWTVTYDPKGLSGIGDYLEDALSEGLAFPLDATGKLDVRQFKVYEDGKPIEPVLDGNIFYDGWAKIMRFEFPDPSKSYRLEYPTYIIGQAGCDEKNHVTLYKMSGDTEETGEVYKVTSADAWAIARLSGWFKLTKVDAATGSPIRGGGGNAAEFTLYAPDGETVVRHGRTDADGELLMHALFEGEYILMETAPPDGYSASMKAYKVNVMIRGTEAITTIDGMTGFGANTFQVENYPDASIGHIRIAKTVSGNAADPKKEFRFTVRIYDEKGAELTEPYYCHAPQAGSVTAAFTSGGTFTLSDGQFIIFYNLPAGVRCVVSENAEGYTASYVIGAAARVSGSKAEALVPNGALRFAFDNYKVTSDEEQELGPGPGSVPGKGPEPGSEPGPGSGSGPGPGPEQEAGQEPGPRTKTQEPEPTKQAIPPVPVPGHSLVPDGGGFIELDEDGTPLGRWDWDEDEDMWIFDGFPPLGNLPQTRDGWGPANLCALLVVAALYTGSLLLARRRKYGRQ